MSDAFHNGMKWVYGLDPQSTFMVMVAALVVGFICLRGFGSRSNY